MAGTETDLSPPLRPGPKRRPDTPPSRRSAPPSALKAGLQQVLTEAKSASRTKRARTGPARSHRYPASVGGRVPRLRLRDTASHNPPEPANLPPATCRLRATTQHTPPCANASCFLASKHMSDYICP